MLRARRHQLHRQHVDCARLARAHEVGEAQVAVAALAREVERRRSVPSSPPEPPSGARRPAVRGARRVVAVVQHDDVVALRHHREVAVRDRRVEHALAEDAVEPVAQPRPALGVDELLVRGAVLAAPRLEAPLPHERGALVEESGVVVQRDAARRCECPRTAAQARGCRRRHRTAPGIASGSVSLNFGPALYGSAFFSAGRPTSCGVGAAGHLHQRLHE